MLTLLSGVVFDRALSVERQITVHVRDSIRSGALSVGMRVPPIRALAGVWGTNYFTVQSALRPLVKEGLLVQSPRLGTFVAEQKQVLQRVCLYHGEDLHFRGGSEFHGRVHLHIYRMLAARGVQTVSYFDHRLGSERGTVPDTVRNLIKDRQVDAVISTTQHQEWMDALDVPGMSLSMPRKLGGVDWDRAGFARLAVKAIVESGRRSVSVLRRLTNAQKLQTSRELTDIKVLVEAEAIRAGLDIVNVPELKSEQGVLSIEETGFLLGENYARQSKRADALVIFPDTYTRGLISALLKHDVSVPDDVMLVSHRNQEMTFFTPFPVTWITAKIEDMAEALLTQVEQRIHGDIPAHIEVPVELESAEPVGKSTRRIEGFPDRHKKAGRSEPPGCDYGCDW